MPKLGPRMARGSSMESGGHGSLSRIQGQSSGRRSGDLSPEAEAFRLNRCKRTWEKIQ